MNQIDFLLEQIKASHNYLEGTMADVTEEHAHFLPPGKANPIGATYVHVLFSEDITISALTNKKPLFASSWMDKTGVSVVMPMPGPDWEKYGEWTKIVRVKLDMLRQYAKAVYKNTEAYLSSLKDTDLQKKADLTKIGMGKADLSYVVGRYILGHTDNITGEIACLKGIQGLKGYPE